MCWLAERHNFADDLTRPKLYDQMLRDLMGLFPDDPEQIDGQRAAACFQC